MCLGTLNMCLYVLGRCGQLDRASAVDVETGERRAVSVRQ
ncbi:hypothetical protein E2C01_082833 [Portunus trituberculatus]|uniref:Uncharacterized protein n=1 Tax=Portunus trituberculatus TaxID=210409 RepID=A0A5B7J049_PORTR|nr:hypothetical protein [Portunus trituberculatus]